jgi:hypothetical protein
MAVLWTHGVKATLSSPRRQTLAQGPGGINSRRGRHTGIMSTVGRAPSACHPNLRKRYNIGQSRNRRSGRK